MILSPAQTWTLLGRGSYTGRDEAAKLTRITAQNPALQNVVPGVYSAAVTSDAATEVARVAIKVQRLLKTQHEDLRQAIAETRALELGHALRATLPVPWAPRLYGARVADDRGDILTVSHIMDQVQPFAARSFVELQAALAQLLAQQLLFAHCGVSHQDPKLDNLAIIGECPVDHRLRVRIDTQGHVPPIDLVVDGSVCSRYYGCLDWNLARWDTEHGSVGFDAENRETWEVSKRGLFDWRSHLALCGGCNPCWSTVVMLCASMRLYAARHLVLQAAQQRWLRTALCLAHLNEECSRAAALQAVHADSDVPRADSAAIRQCWLNAPGRRIHGIMLRDMIHRLFVQHDCRLPQPATLAQQHVVQVDECARTLGNLVYSTTLVDQLCCLDAQIK
jgi:hypothetical protein